MPVDMSGAARGSAPLLAAEISSRIPPMNQRAKSWIKFVLRCGIAVVGIWWVVAQMEFRDRVWILDPKNHPVPARLITYPEKGEQSPTFEIRDPWTNQKRVIPRKDVVSRPDQKELIVAYF